MDLMKAIALNNKALVTSSLHHGYNVNGISFGTLPPLVQGIIQKCDLSIIQLLIDNGAHLDKALVRACQTDYFEAFKLILEAGGNVNSMADDKLPLVHLACSKGEQYLKLVLLHGGNVNVLCLNKQTALHYSIAEKCDSAVISLLLSFKVDLGLKNKDGVNAEELALSTDSLEAVTLIKASKVGTVYNRRKSVKPKDKENLEEQSALMSTLNKAEKKLRSSQRFLEQHQRKVEQYSKDVESSSKQCTSLRKDIARSITGENIEDTKSHKSVGVKRKLQFECPICFHDFDSNSKIYQCPEGHLICEKCKENKKMKTHCPQCHCAFPKKDIRNRALENIVAECSTPCSV